jgi:hypothetical protein
MAICNGIIGNGDGCTAFKRMILTEFLFREVQEYLDYPNININNILNVSRKFHDLKKAYYYWEVNRHYSLMYHNDVIYKARLDLLLCDTRTQLSLDLTDLVTSDVSALGIVHTLCFFVQ